MKQLGEHIAGSAIAWSLYLFASFPKADSRYFWHLGLLPPIIWRVSLSQAPTGSVGIGFEKRPSETSGHTK